MQLSGSKKDFEAKNTGRYYSIILVFYLFSIQYICKQNLNDYMWKCLFEMYMLEVMCVERIIDVAQYIMMNINSSQGKLLMK